MDLDPRDYDLGELRGSPSTATERGADREDGIDGNANPSERVTESGTDVGSSLRENDRESSETDRSTHDRSAGRSDERGLPLDVGPALGRPGGQPTWGASDDRYRPLAAIEQGVDDIEKPYLKTLPTGFTDEVLVFEWLSALLTTAGRSGTIEALRYYRELEWITKPVESDLRDHLVGLGTRSETATTALRAEDHLDSLIVVARLAAGRGKE